MILSATCPSIAYHIFVISDGDDFLVNDMFRQILLGLGKSPRRLVNLPHWLIALLAHCLGFSRLFHQVTDELIVDSSAFCRAIGWKPVVSSKASLRQSAASFR